MLQGAKQTKSMVDSLKWTYFDRDGLIKLRSITNRDDVEEQLLSQCKWPMSHGSDVVGEILFYTLAFCREYGMNLAQTSVTLALLYSTVLEDAYDYGKSQSESFASFEKKLVSHSVDRPPASEYILSRRLVPEVAAHVIRAYYRQFKLFKASLCAIPELVLKQQNTAEVEDPACPAALAGATFVAELEPSKEEGVSTSATGTGGESKWDDGAEGGMALGGAGAPT